MQNWAFLALLGSMVLQPQAPGDAKPSRANYRVASWIRQELPAETSKQEPYEQWMTRSLQIRFRPRMTDAISFLDWDDFGGHLGAFSARQQAGLQALVEAAGEQEHFAQERSAQLKLLPGTFHWLWQDLGRENDRQRPANPFCVEDGGLLQSDSNPDAWKIADWLEANDPLFLRHEIVPEVTEIGIGTDFDMTPTIGTGRTTIDRPIDLLRSPLLHGTFVGIRFRF
jgi:hypothetical protein